MKYRIELRKSDRSGDLIPSTASGLRHPTLYQAWTAAMHDARLQSTARCVPVCVLVFDPLERLAASGTVGQPQPGCPT
jgi:hypothetical protein